VESLLEGDLDLRGFLIISKDRRRSIMETKETKDVTAAAAETDAEAECMTDCCTCCCCDTEEECSMEE
jgi:hypothetical protein